LEDRIRGYEQEAVKANVGLQQLAKRLDYENKKMKKSLQQAHGLDGEDVDTDVLIAKVTTQKLARKVSLPSPPAEGTGVGELTVALKPYEENGQGRSELQLISSIESEDVTVPCYVSYELLMSLLDEQDPLASEIRALERRNGSLL
jgi:hypothetical protein